MKLYALTLATLFSINFAHAGTGTVDLSGLTDPQSVIVQSQLKLFSEIAESKITSRNHQQYSKDLQTIIYCGYEVFSNNQSKFSHIMKVNEDLIFDTKLLKNKYQSLIKNQLSLPNDLSICTKFHDTQIALSYGNEVMDELF
ncbi:hypothetical protein CTM97_16070 [Photobacterium phosphoreum]|uniref:Uncharacterized protein n=1 Tax=Photobacterium phosphoreum TaxID=659 RepID=A0A2T3JTE3_PHOPO|nr:hypothetical protein [Photobacterium phosphoreum]PSU21221.1 hypothetical protein CTM96_18135 [Photobacterium phosphoreum]PSU40185.1 hypothetical protein CTM97_16070 [Photobacterium phosphoreum]PSU52389.1 hypothetical protein C9J18_09605 [Photobacterium phosphoreum]